MEKGAEKCSVEIEVARAMLAGGEPIEKIKFYTSLIDEDILILQKEVSN